MYEAALRANCTGILTPKRWSLVAGRWSLVAGRWSLVAGRESWYQKYRKKCTVGC